MSDKRTGADRTPRKRLPPEHPDSAQSRWAACADRKDARESARAGLKEFYEKNPTEDPKYKKAERDRVLKEGAKLYGQGMSGKNAMIKAGSESPMIDTREMLATPKFLREALHEARNSRVRFATLDRLARYKIVKHLADDSTPAIVDAQICRLVFDTVRRGGDKSLAEAVMDEDRSMSDLERAQRMLDETMAEDAEAQKSAIDVDHEEVKDGIQAKKAQAEAEIDPDERVETDPDAEPNAET